jgi:hypothetical protein
MLVALMRRVALVVFAAQFAVLDALLRHPPMPVWVPSAVASSALWMLAASLGGSRVVRTIVALASAGTLVVQVIFFRYYHVFLDEDGVGAAQHMWHDVRPTLVGLVPGALLITALATVVDFGLLSWSTRAVIGPRWRIAAFAVCALALVPRARDASPDLAAFSSLGVLFGSKEARAAGDVAVRPMPSRRAHLPNVLLILDESVRASDYDADTTPETTALTRDRIELIQMRSVASYTSIAVSSLLTSLPPTAREAQLKSAPYLFDYVCATHRVGERPTVAYLSAQTAELFERREVRAATDLFVTIDDLLGHHVEESDDELDHDIDGLLADRVERELPKLPLPLFAMVHLGGTHAPYYVDDAHAPFKPYRHTPSWSGLAELHAAYRDAIVHQDAVVARIVRAFLARAAETPVVIVFTSDHGEAFGEHTAIHHGQSLYGEQIHVPAWVLARGGALDGAQVTALASHAGDVVTHLDILPTLLDAYGVMDSLEMREHAAHFAGRSLLRPTTAIEALPLTNCTDLFPCPVRTWGVLGRGRALIAQPWDAVWRCVDLATDTEVFDDPTCARVYTSSRTLFPNLPNGMPN